MSRLLEIVERVCGRHVRASVFQPLVADWQRELASSTSTRERLTVIVSGSVAFGWSLMSCMVTGGGVMPRAVVIKALGVLAISTLALLTIQIGLNATALKNDFPFEMRFWMALPMILPLVIPLGLLPVMMLMRGTGRVTTGGAASLVCTGALLAYVTAGWLTPLLRADVRDELYEEIEQRMAADERAGRVFYPSTAVRQARPMTPEQRAAAREHWRQSPQYLAAQAAQTRPRWGRATILTALLALAMGALGWGLGALRHASALRAGAWWALAWIAMMFLDGRFLYPGNGVASYIGRAPYWMPLAVFTTSALVLLIVERRRLVRAD